MDIFTQSFSMQTQTIVLAEDDGDDILVFREVISDFQITINLHLAKDGLDTIKLLDKLPDVDLIFLDVNMPLMNGLECLAEIRKKTRPVPVFMLSTSNSELDVSRAKMLGANGFITKPTSVDQYRLTIKHVMTTNWGKEHTPFYIDM